MKNNRRSTKLSPRQIKKLIIIAVLAAAVITGLLLFLRKRVSDQFAGSSGTEVSSAAVTAGSISTSVYGSGRLSDDDVEQLDIPSGVELEKIYVSLSDRISEGDILASVKMSSVLSAMSDISDELDSLDEQISSAAGSSSDSYISSSVSGRVKKVYAEPGDSVASVMYEHGALALISLDGYMAVDIENGTLSAGDSVTMTASDGKSYSGTVSAAVDGTATVLVTDNGTVYGDSVTAEDENGNTLGSGTLYIHDELKAVGYTGSVSYVYVSGNSYVYSGSSLMALTDTANTAGYQSLLSQREEKEETLQQLIRIYKEGALYSALSGTVNVINAADSETSESSSASSSDEQYISISPDKTMSMSVSVDESEILSVSIGQKASVTIDSIDGETFSGTVTAIDKAGTSSSGVTTYTAGISIDKTDAMLSGMSASATIMINGVENALLIPVDALNMTSSSYYVYTSYDESTGELGGMKEVTVGITNSNYAEITSGLSEGDTVYYIEKQTESFGFGMPGDSFGGGMPGGGGLEGAPSGGSGRGGQMPSGGGPGGFPGRDEVST